MKTAIFATALALTAFSAAAEGWPIEARAFFSTNADGAVGKPKTITIDGKFDDWTDDMIIATGGANDIANAFKGSHENCLLDCYALYAAWDDSNLYMAWQMVNTGDTWAREGDGPLTDGGRIGDVPFILALSIDPKSTTMSGKVTDGRFIWGEAASGVTFTSHADRLLFMSAKPGQGTPAIFKAVNDKGDSDYGAGCTTFANCGITYNWSEGFAPSHLWRQNTHAEWADPTTLLSDPSIVNNIYDAANYDNLMDGTPEGLKPHNTKYDSFFEIKIPFAALGINRQWLEANGIGARLLATRGESALDCLPFDPAMMDNALGEYGKDNSTTHEKDDIDKITYAPADIAKVRDLGSIVTPPDDPVTPPVDPVDPVDPDPEQPEGSWHVYFIDGSWTSVNVWIWDGNDSNINYTGGTWPGAAMTPTRVNGKEGWVYAFNPNEPFNAPKVIFSSGSEQTKDLDLENNGIYSRSGKTGSYAGIESVTVDSNHEPAIWYDLQGRRVLEPTHGLYIRVQSGKAEKIVR